MDKESRKLKRDVRKAENTLFRSLFKLIFAIVALGLQIGFFVAFFNTTGRLYASKTVIYSAIRIGAILYLIYKHDSATYKLAWTLFIMFMPVFGVCVFVIWGNSRLKNKKQMQIKDIENDTNHLLDNSFELCEDILSKDKDVAKTLNYIQNMTSYPICKNISSKYYNLGDKAFIDLKKDLLDAKKYIFMEFFIIDKGELSSDVFRILKDKARAGVEVKIIYDDYGCLGKFTKKDKEDLKRAGVKLYVFNPISIFINSYLNNRLHRKLVAIDGKVSYTGGFNLADEYANIKERFGHWKDAGIRFEGEISWEFSLMFLRDLSFVTKNRNIDYDKYKNISIQENITADTKNSEGIAVAIADGPNNRKNPVESVYMQIINSAKDYVYITTPYFAISEPMLNAILNAARSGVDVRIILPHIPDKKIVQMSTRSYYEVLLSAGVKVYEYLPGFIHSKTFVSDDKIATVGSANMDYRSMNLDYECISLIYETKTEEDIKKDFLNMVEKACMQVELKNWIKRPFIKKITEAIFTTFSTMF